MYLIFRSGFALCCFVLCCTVHYTTAIQYRLHTAHYSLFSTHFLVRHVSHFSLLTHSLTHSLTSQSLAHSPSYLTHPHCPLRTCLKLLRMQEQRNKASSASSAAPLAASTGSVSGSASGGGGVNDNNSSVEQAMRDRSTRPDTAAGAVPTVASSDAGKRIALFCCNEISSPPVWALPLVHRW